MNYLKIKAYDSTTNLVEIAGLSTDSKPTTGIAGGSKFIETNTGKTFVFDSFTTPKAWHEMVVATAEVSP